MWPGHMADQALNDPETGGVMYEAEGSRVPGADIREASWWFIQAWRAM